MGGGVRFFFLLQCRVAAGMCGFCLCFLVPKISLTLALLPPLFHVLECVRWHVSRRVRGTHVWY
jgi:hypothetical protein